MKKIRYFPFGYYMNEGKIKIVADEASLIRHIFTQYLSGSSLQQISDSAQATGINFRDTAAKWNKNMIARILEDKRYWENKMFPPIISSDLAKKAVELKQKKAVPKSSLQFLQKQIACFRCGGNAKRNSRNSPKIYWDCPNCGMRIGPISDQEFLCVVTQKILTLCREPEKVVPDPVLNQAIPIQVIRLTNEINQMLDQREVDPERALALILECAAEKYYSCQVQGLDYQTLKIQKLLEAHIHDNSLDQQLFEQIVKKVILHPGGSVQLQLVNYKII